MNEGTEGRRDRACAVTPESHTHNDREFIERIILSRKANLILEQTILEEGKVQKTLSSCKDWFLQRYFILEICFKWCVDLFFQRVEELNCKLVFLNKRFAQASDTDWKGMFRKPPFW